MQSKDRQLYTVQALCVSDDANLVAACQTRLPKATWPQLAQLQYCSVGIKATLIGISYTVTYPPLILVCSMDAVIRYI